MREFNRDAPISAIISIIFLLFVTGCLQTNTLYHQIYTSIVYPDKIGPWINIYKGDPNLAGVIVQQYGDQTPEYAHKHPAIINYYLWDGRVRQLGYLPDGTVKEDFWCADMKPGDVGWDGVDFSYGSDPHFEHHKNPRILK